ncbi:MAG: helix-turn-helix domain-containing protein [Pseudonocardiaceae bacterium]
MTPPTPATTEQRTETVLEEAGLLTLLTVEQAAQRLAISRTTMYALLKAGQVNSVRIGRLRRIPAEELTDYTARLIAQQHAA